MDYIKATHEEVCDMALKHYDELSSKACDWSSTVVHALEFYKKYGAVSDERSEESSAPLEQSECKVCKTNGLHSAPKDTTQDLSDWEKKFDELIKNETTFGHIEDEDFYPAMLFKSRSEQDRFVDSVKDFIKEELEKARKEGAKEVIELLPEKLDFFLPVGTRSVIYTNTPKKHLKERFL